MFRLRSLARPRPAAGHAAAEFDAEAYAELMLNLGVRSLDQGRLGAAATHLRASLRGHRETGNQAGIQESLTMLGLVAEADGAPQLARHYLEESLSIARLQGDRIGVNEILLNLGRVLGELRDPSASTVLEEAVSTASELENPEALGRALLDLGRDAEHAGHHEEALRHCEAALSTWREAGFTAGEMVALNDLALIQRALETSEQAVETAYEALQLAEELNLKPQQTAILDNLASMLHTDQPAEASGLYEWALELAEQSGDDRRRAWLLTRMASVELALGRPEVAAGLFEKALEIEPAPDRAAEVAARFGLAIAAAELGRDDESRRQHELAASIALPAAGPQGLSLLTAEVEAQLQCQLLITVSRAAASDGRLSEAIARAGEAVELAREDGYREGQCAGLNELAVLEAEQGNFQKSRRLLTEGLQLARETGRWELIQALLGNRAWVAGLAGDARAEHRDLEERVRWLRDAGSPELPRCLHRLAELSLELPSSAAAAELLREAGEMIAGSEEGDLAAHQLELEGRLAFGLGQEPQAIALISRAARVRYGEEGHGSINPARYCEVLLGSPPRISPKEVDEIWTGS